MWCQVGWKEPPHLRSPPSSATSPGSCLLSIPSCRLPCSEFCSFCSDFLFSPELVTDPCHSEGRAVAPPGLCSVVTPQGASLLQKLPCSLAQLHQSQRAPCNKAMAETRPKPETFASRSPQEPRRGHSQGGARLRTRASLVITACPGWWSRMFSSQQLQVVFFLQLQPCAVGSPLLSQLPG